MDPIDLGKKSFNPEELNTPIPADPTPVEPAPVDPPTTPKKEEQPKREYTPEEKRLYARLKDAEKELDDYKKNPSGSPTPSNPSDPFELAKTVASLRDYDSRELEFASMVSKAKGISPTEAVQTDDFKIFLSGKRAIDLKNNSIPRPNSSAPSGSTKTSEEIASMSDKEFAQYEKEYQSKQQGGGI